MYNLLKELFGANQERIEFDAFDWSALGVLHKYIILITGRSGSTLLTKLMNNVNKCGNPDEFFTEDYIAHVKRNMEIDNIAGYFKHITKQHTKNGYFGFEINAERFFWLDEIVCIKNVLRPESRL